MNDLLTEAIYEVLRKHRSTGILFCEACGPEFIPDERFWVELDAWDTDGIVQHQAAMVAKLLSRD